MPNVISLELEEESSIFAAVLFHLQNKTKQSKRNKTKQNKTKQNQFCVITIFFVYLKQSKSTHKMKAQAVYQRNLLLSN